MDEKPTILIIDDEVKVIDIVKILLESKGYLVLTAENGEDGYELFKRNPITLVLLDLMLPGISGEELCIKIRRASRVPIIILTAKVSENDLVNGFDYGADDYITKPFGLKELSVRIDAVLRRSTNDLATLFQKCIFCDDDLVIDFENRNVSKQGHYVALTPNEYKILNALVKFPNKTFTRDELAQTALGKDYEGFDRTVDSHIKNIRQKIETDSKNPVYIITVHGIGYKFGGQ